MHKPVGLLLGLGMTLAALGPRSAHAQQLELPRPSPLAKVSQVVGLTEITVEYSSPGVKGRAIWGSLVPYDKLWRTGANLATKVTFSKDVVVGDKAVPAGSYALLSIPGQSSWTLILNKNINLVGTDGYSQDLDVVRVTTMTETAAPRERLTFVFSSTNDESTRLDLEWEKLRVSLPIQVKTDEQVRGAIDQLSQNAWRPLNNAARYLFENKKDIDGAIKLVDRSILLQETWSNVWTKAQLTAAKGNWRAAHGLAEKAQQLGNKTPQGFFLADEVKNAIAEWKTKR